MATIGSAHLEVKRGNAPDVSRPFTSHGHAELHKVGKATVMRAVFEPGWIWSKHVAPIAGTELCQSPHFGYIAAGRLKVRMEDGTEAELGPGDFFKIASGHDAWVVGSERCIIIDFAGNEHYAEPPRPLPGRARRFDATSPRR